MPLRGISGLDRHPQQLYSRSVKKDTGYDRALVPTPSDQTVGPAMSALTDLQRRFVIALCTQADVTNETQAARTAGYATPSADAARLMRSPKVLAAIREEADKRMRAGALIGARGLIEIAMDPSHKQRFQACQALLDRAGLQVIAEQKIVIEDNRTDKEIVDYILAIEKKHGIDPGTLLGQNMIEGEFREVSADEFTLPAEEDDAADDLEGEGAPA